MKQTKKQKAALRERMRRLRASSEWRRKKVNREYMRKWRARKKLGRGVEVELEF